MGTSLDSRDDRHAYMGYISQTLTAFVVNLAPNAGIGGIAEGGPLDISNELPTSAREDYDFVCSILRNSVEGIDKFRVRSRGHNEWPAVAVELNDKYAFGVARQLQITIGGEVVILMCLHSIFLSLFEPQRTSSLVHACKTCSTGQWTPEPITRPDDVSITRSVPIWSKEAFALKLVR